MKAEDKDSILDILLHSQEKELNEEKILKIWEKLSFLFGLRMRLKKWESFFYLWNNNFLLNKFYYNIIFLL